MQSIYVLKSWVDISLLPGDSLIRNPRIHIYHDEKTQNIILSPNPISIKNYILPIKSDVCSNRGDLSLQNSNTIGPVSKNDHLPKPDTNINHLSPQNSNTISSASKNDHLPKPNRENHTGKIWTKHISDLNDVEIASIFFTKDTPTIAYLLSLLPTLPKIKEIEIMLWGVLSGNCSEHAVDILLANLDKVNYYGLSTNPNKRVIDFLKTNIDKVCWCDLCGNTGPGVVDILRERLIVHPEDVNWYEVFSNKGPGISEFILENMDEIEFPRELCDKKHMPIEWKALHENEGPGIVDVLRKRLYNVDFNRLIKNNGPGITEFLRENAKFIEWDKLSNDEQIRLVRDRLGREYVRYIASNPLIFKKTYTSR